MTPTGNIRRAQREAALFKKISELFLLAAREDKDLAGVFITRVSLSQDKGFCTVFFYSADGEEHFKQILERLKLYKPSLRKALAQTIASRYVPEIVFAFDAVLKKQLQLEELIEKVKTNEGF